MRLVTSSTRAALELALHAHDVCVGLDIPFEPPAAITRRLREHTRPWPMWTTEWNGLGDTDDAWVISSPHLAAAHRRAPGRAERVINVRSGAAY